MHTATTYIYTLSLHDALPIFTCGAPTVRSVRNCIVPPMSSATRAIFSSARRPPSWKCCAFLSAGRSEEHTSELQSHSDLVCRLLLEKKKSRMTRSLQHILHKI